MKKEHKVVWVKPNTNPQRCPIRLVEKYINLLPLTGSKPNFYLQSLKKVRPNCWYSSVPVRINSIRKVVGELLKEAGLDGYFTYHSLRCTCATRLFQAGTNVKLVKEVTGHVSDSVYKYQTTSDAQKMSVSSIVQGDIPPIKLSEAAPMEVVQYHKEKPLEEKCKLDKLVLPIQVQKQGKSEESVASNIGHIVELAVKSVAIEKQSLPSRLNC